RRGPSGPARTAPTTIATDRWTARIWIAMGPRPVHPRTAPTESMTTPTACWTARMRRATALLACPRTVQMARMTTVTARSIARTLRATASRHASRRTARTGSTTMETVRSTVSIRIVRACPRASTRAAWWASGASRSGQLGEGAWTDSRVPVQVSGLTGVVAIAAGAAHALALLGAGTVLSWGANNWGQLGDGTFGDSNFPGPVVNLSGIGA